MGVTQNGWFIGESSIYCCYRMFIYQEMMMEHMMSKDLQFVFDLLWDMGVSIAMGGTPIAGGFIRENPTRMDDLRVPPFEETSI